MRLTRPILVLLLIAGFFLPWARAQSIYGRVSGRLMEESGAPVAGASISLISVQTGAHARTQSDSDGYFSLNNLVPDLYEIDVRAERFKTVRGTIAVSNDSTTTVNSKLQKGDPGLVEGAQVSLLKLDRTDISSLFNARTIVDLPLLNQNITRLLTLVPGAERGQPFIPSNQNPQNGLAINMNGQFFSGTALQLDGTEDRDPLEGIAVINPAVDSVQEIKVTTEGYGAEFGQATAGVVTIQTKGGSNVWHGDGFGFRRTGWGEAVDPFTPAGVPPSKHEIFGGTVGGPLKRDRLFLFGDYQGTRFGQGANVLLNVLPNNLRSTCLNGKNCDLSEFGPAILGGRLYAVSGTQKTYFPSNIIPATDISPAAVAIFSLLPSPNYTSSNPSCGNSDLCDNYLASGQETFRGDQFDLRSDYNAGGTLRTFGRYSLGDFRDEGTPAFGTVAGGWGLNPAGFGGVARTRNQGISAGLTDSIGGSLSTDLRFGFFRYRLNMDAQDFGQIPPALGNALKNTFNTGDPFSSGMPDIQIPGQQGPEGALFSRVSSDYIRLGYSFNANVCECPLREHEQLFQLANNWTRAAGHHSIRFGIDLRYLQNYRLNSDRPHTGYFTFAPAGSGLALATFLLGEVTGFQRIVSTPAALNAGERQKRAGFYGQDTWRVNSRLTVNYGLRWEVYFPQTVTGSGMGGFLVPDLNNNDPSTTYFNAPPAVGTNGNVRGNLSNFGPRVGFAFLANSSTVIRAGYGRSFDAGYGGAIFGLSATQNPPVTANQFIGQVFSLDQGPPTFAIPQGSRISLFDLAAANNGIPNSNPLLAAPPSGADLFALATQVKVPTVDSWNLTLQHIFNPRLSFELSYIGSKGTHIFVDNGVTPSYNLSQPTLNGFIVPVSNSTTCKAPPATKQMYCISSPSTRGFFRSEAGPCPGRTTPCTFSSVLFPVAYFNNGSNNNYNSLQARLEKSFSQGYSFLAHYTWSKAFDYGSNYFRVEPEIDYGPAAYDVSHSFVMTNIWDLPLGRGKAAFGNAGPVANRLIAGWTMAAITRWRSGFPFTPSYNTANCVIDVDSGDPCRPNVVGPVHILGDRNQYFQIAGSPLKASCSVSGSADCPPMQPTSQQGYNAMTGAPLLGQTIGPWQRPAAGQIGNAARDSLRGPSFFQTDIAVAKNFALSERANLIFRADAFNVFNKVNLGSPNTCVDCSNGGAISAIALDAVQREFQFSVRVAF